MAKKKSAETEPEVEAVEPETEAESKPSATKTITIDGEGPITFHSEGAAKTMERGKPVEVTDADIAALKAAEVEFKEGKSHGKK